MTYRKTQRRSRYQARMVRRDKNAAWAADAQARLKAWYADVLKDAQPVEEKPLHQWSDRRLAKVVREIALMADTDSLAPDRSRWAGAADILMTAADRIEKEEEKGDE
jgi:hypothetical protein